MQEEGALTKQGFAAVVLEKALESFSKCSEADLAQFIEDTYAYYCHTPVLLEDIENSFYAVKVDWNLESQKNRNASSMDLERPSNRSFIDRAFKKLQGEKLHHINLYSAGGKASESQAHAEEITKTTKMSLRIIQHKEAYQGAKVLKGLNEGLNFSKSAREEYISVAPKIKETKQRNFLYHKPQDFLNAFTAGYERMERLANQFLPKYRLLENDRERDVRWYKVHRVSEEQNTISEETLILARLTLDDDGEFNAQKLLGEVMDSKNNTREVYLNFQNVAPDSRQQLFPNMYAVLAVEGSLVDENTPLRVNRIVEIDCDQDKRDEAQTAARAVRRHMCVLVFKGPFTFDGNAYFGILEMVRLHAKEHNPNLVLLIGPFVPEDQATETSELKVRGSYQHLRDENLGNFKKMLYDAGVRCEIAIVPDQSEADNFFPTPMPAMPPVNTALVRQNPSDITKLLSFSSPCLLELKTDQSAPITIAVTSQDFLRNYIAKFYTFSKSKKYLDAMKSVISQLHLHPAYPMPYPYDVTLQEKLCLDQAPDLWVCPSSIVSFAELARGCMVVNPKSVLNGDDNGSFARLLIDTSPESHDRTARDRVKVEILQF